MEETFTYEAESCQVLSPPASPPLHEVALITDGQQNWEVGEVHLTCPVDNSATLLLALVPPSRFSRT